MVLLGRVLRVREENENDSKHLVLVFRGSPEGTWKWERQEALGSCKFLNEAQLAQLKKAPVCWVGGPSSNLCEALIMSCWLCLRPRLTFPTFLYKTWQNVHTRNKTLAPIDRWPAWLGNPFSMLGHPLNQANVSAAHKHLIWLAHPKKIGSTPENQSVRECCSQVLAKANGPIFSHNSAC